jgi:hypothetical protein
MNLISQERVTPADRREAEQIRPIFIHSVGRGDTDRYLSKQRGRHNEITEKTAAQSPPGPSKRNIQGKVYFQNASLYIATLKN